VARRFVADAFLAAGRRFRDVADLRAAFRFRVAPVFFLADFAM
jgi:hypothetical protein